MCAMCGNVQTGYFSADDGAGHFGDAGTASVYKIVTQTGNQLIDGVLSGVAWKFTQFSVSYPTSGLSYGTQYGQGEQTSFQAFNQVQRQAADWARNLMADYCPITYVAGSETSANLRYGNFQAGDNQVTHGYYPDGGRPMGDMWYSQKNGDQFQAGIGSFAMATILHEQGHTMGLKHGHGLGINDDGTAATAGDNANIPNYGALPTQFDNWNYSLMTYRSYTGAQTAQVQGGFTSDNPVTFMMADIAALQHMYGANYSGNSSTSTTYQWDAQGNFFENGQLFLPAAAGGKVFQTIWDGGGNDTYDTSNFSTNQTIDLRPGQFSTFDASKLADLDKDAARVVSALGNVANALLFNNDPRSLIENASTGAGSDNIIGNGANNTLNGGGGDDILMGLGGNDTLNGGAGNDFASYQGAAQAVNIDLNAQKVNAGTDGIDTLISIEHAIGGNGNDIINCQSSGALASISNLIGGGAGNDTIYGYGGNDQLLGEDGDDYLRGDADNDSLYGGNGNDYLYGGDGLDYLNGGAGGDTIYGERDADTIQAGDGADYVDGGIGNDTIYGEGGDDILAGWEGDDYVSGGEGNDTVYGQNGNDTIDGGNGFDALYGDAGNDTVRAGEGDDYINGGAGNDFLFGEGGNDTIQGGSENDYISGGAGNDTLLGEAGADTLDGNGGNDQLTGGAGGDAFGFNAGWGVDTITDFAHEDKIYFNSGAFANFAAVQAHMQQVGNNTLITFDANNAVYILGMAPVNLSAADFGFF